MSGIKARFSATPAPHRTSKEKMVTADWSFQETAIENVLKAFDVNPASKVGLVLPTGAGKTRVALRIALARLAAAPCDQARVYWVTHRRNLRKQAKKELQKLLNSQPDRVNPRAAQELDRRIDFVMVSELQWLLAPSARAPLLVIVDEAHHAAAPSYAPIFDAPYPVTGLFLTATPNRTDALPIGIDEIAFTITYRELSDRGVVLTPEFVDFPVADFEWLDDQVERLATFIVEQAAERFTKTLVLAPRVDRVEEFHDRLAAALSAVRGHPLDPDDIGYIHGSGNSLHLDNDDFLDLFAEKPRAIIVSAKILLEGFDDPGVNTVVMTYPSNSLVLLMQATGRCVRYSTAKENCYVVQARNDDLAYHFDQRWLYQEISDYLRPEIIDIDYASEDDLHARIAHVLGQHRVDGDAILSASRRALFADTCRILLYGLPYAGAPADFDHTSRWGFFLETDASSQAFRHVFNSFCAQGADLSDPSHFLTREAAPFGVHKDLRKGSMWRELMNVLTACHLANSEIRNPGGTSQSSSRPYRPHGPTTWLKYVTFRFRPPLDTRLADFLEGCYNRSLAVSEYQRDPSRFAAAVKMPIPYEGFEAFLLSTHQAATLDTHIDSARTILHDAEPELRINKLAGYLAEAPSVDLPVRLLLRMEAFLPHASYEAYVLPLQQTNQEARDDQFI